MAAGQAQPGARRWGPAGAALLYDATSLALVWRRRAPLAVLAFVVSADAAYYLAYGAPEGLGTVLPTLAALYAVGRYAPPVNVCAAAPWHCSAWRCASSPTRSSA